MDIEAILSNGSIAQIRNAYISSHLSILDATRWYLERIEKFNGGEGGINAVRELSPRALEEAGAADRLLASGAVLPPLFGIPILLKDNILTEDGMTATIGAAALKGFVPRRDATIVSRLRRSGAIILGKTNMTEFADYTSDIMPSEFSGAGGVVRNPRGQRFGRGQGSSIGSAAAVAAAFAPVAIGGESQNSIQSPASHTGTVGYKPTVGLISRAGIAPLVPSQDTIGPFARCVEDAILVASVMAGPDCRDSVTYVRSVHAILPDAAIDLGTVTIGVPRVAMADSLDDAGALSAMNGVLKRLARAGATIMDPCDLPGAAELAGLRSAVFRTEFKQAFGHFLIENGCPNGFSSLADIVAWNDAHEESIPYGQSLLIAAAETGGLEDQDYRADRQNDLRLAIDEGIDAALERSGADVLLAPMGVAAKCTGKAGAPALTMPAGVSSDGRCYGITLYTSVGNDQKLLAIGRAVTREIGLPFEASISRS